MAYPPLQTSCRLLRRFFGPLLLSGMLAATSWAQTDNDVVRDNTPSRQEEGVADSPAPEVNVLPDAVANLSDRGVEIVGELSVPGGLAAYAAIAKQQPLAIYLTPDQEHVIIGTMMDADGMDVTTAALEEATVSVWTSQTWQLLENSTWIADGSDDADRILYMFTDPNCPFCHKFWTQARPWVEAGRVQIRHIPVALLADTSAGKAAAWLVADDPSKALNEHETAGPQAGIEPLTDIPEAIAVQLDDNQELMDTLKIEGTPGIFYFDSDNLLQIQRGAPLDNNLPDILGPNP